MMRRRRSQNNPHENNYEIHDKEMLAIIRCLEEWDSELRTVEKFTVLGRYNITLQYRPGKLNERADAVRRWYYYRGSYCKATKVKERAGRRLVFR
jgi:hypothetical protein